MIIEVELNYSIIQKNYSSELILTIVLYKYAKVWNIATDSFLLKYLAL